MLFNQASFQEISIDDIDTLCQHYLNVVYDNLGAFSTSASSIPETYGEILYQSVDKLMSHIQLSEQDIFVDLGSGTGKIVIQFFLKSLIKEAYGIEILPELHLKAEKAAKRLQYDFPDLFQSARTVTFHLGSFLEIPFTTATVALVNATCFTQTLLNSLGTIIENTPSIHTVLSLRPINTLRRLVFKKAIRVECSWDSALCYIYRATPTL